NARCPGSHVTRLRFVVAAGRMKAMLDGLVRGPQPRATPKPETQTQGVDDAPDAADAVVRRLRRRQQALDRRRQRDGWARCAVCAAWRPPTGDPAEPGAIWAEAERRAGDARTGRARASAPPL